MTRCKKYEEKHGANEDAWFDFQEYTDKWITQEGEEMSPCELTAEHLMNCIKMIERCCSSEELIPTGYNIYLLLVKEAQKRGLIKEAPILNQAPPYECVPWFKRHFTAGDKIEFEYDGGLGGVNSVSGTIEGMEPPFIKLKGNDTLFLMGNIFSVIKKQ